MGVFVHKIFNFPLSKEIIDCINVLEYNVANNLHIDDCLHNLSDTVLKCVSNNLLTQEQADELSDYFFNGMYKYGEIANLSSDLYISNERLGIYAGNAGSKDAITINGEYWLIKYPQNTQSVKGDDLRSYTTAPLSEYIGSHIYKSLGVDTHNTILGLRHNKLVVACKDFCKYEGALREIRKLKNAYIEELEEILSQSISSTSDSHYIDIEDIFLQIDYNPILSKVPEVAERFWLQFIVDMLINNNDRNNGNWGVLYENGEYRLAPVFDNGSSFSNKHSEEKLKELLDDEAALKKVMIVMFRFIEEVDIEYTAKICLKLMMMSFIKWLFVSFH